MNCHCGHHKAKGQACPNCGSVHSGPPAAPEKRKPWGERGKAKKKKAEAG